MNSKLNQCLEESIDEFIKIHHESESKEERNEGKEETKTRDIDNQFKTILKDIENLNRVGSPDFTAQTTNILNKINDIVEDSNNKDIINQTLNIFKTFSPQHENESKEERKESSDEERRSEPNINNIFANLLNQFQNDTKDDKNPLDGLLSNIFKNIPNGGHKRKTKSNREMNKDKIVPYTSDMEHIPIDIDIEPVFISLGSARSFRLDFFLETERNEPFSYAIVNNKDYENPDFELNWNTIHKGIYNGIAECDRDEYQNWFVVIKADKPCSCYLEANFHNLSLDYDSVGRTDTSESEEETKQIGNEETTEGTSDIDNAHSYSTGCCQNDRKDEDIRRTELLRKVRSLKRSHPDNKFENLTSDLDYDTLNENYEKEIKRLKIKERADHYKTILKFIFTLIESVVDKRGFKDARGFSEGQISDIDKYDELLFELAEKNFEPPEPSSSPVEVRLFLVIFTSMFTYIMLKRLQRPIEEAERPREDLSQGQFRFTFDKPIGHPVPIVRIPQTSPISKGESLFKKRKIDTYTCSKPKPQKKTVMTTKTVTRGSTTTTTTKTVTTKY